MGQEPHECRDHLLEEGQGTLIPYLVSSSSEHRALHPESSGSSRTHAVSTARAGQGDPFGWLFGTQCLLLNEHPGAIQEGVERWSRMGPPGGSLGGQGRAAPLGERSFFGGALAAGFFA